MTPTDAIITDLVVDALDDLKAVDTKIVDVRGLSSVMDFLVVASGNSSRHVKSLADNVVVKAKELDVHRSVSKAKMTLIGC